MKIELDVSQIKPKRQAKEPPTGTLPGLMKTLREAANMTQGEVAEILELNRSSVTMLERKDANVNFAFIEKLANHVGLNVVISFVPITTDEIKKG